MLTAPRVSGNALEHGSPRGVPLPTRPETVAVVGTLHAIKVLFAFENVLPSREADAEVFLATAGHLAKLVSRAWLHVPRRSNPAGASAFGDGLDGIRAWAPASPAALRHVCCGLTLPLRRAFRRADLVYTRNLFVAWMALLSGGRVVFDHYRPWPEQIPPLQFWLYRLMCHPGLLVNICHSDYTRARYLALGVPERKLHCVRNGFDPRQMGAPIAAADAKLAIGVGPLVRTVVYTGRLNHKKGLDLAIAAARQLPDILFVLVGSYGVGPIETLAAGLANVRIVPWQPSGELARYLYAADILLIPPSREPLARFGSTVLPLKLFLYMASGRPILAGDTADVGEVLQHGRNAWLCRPDCVESLVAGVRSLTGNPALAASLAQTALADSREYTWAARARRIAAIVADRLRPALHQGVHPASGYWGRGETRRWGRQSWRWLVHMVRTGSFVLAAHEPRAADRA